MAEKIRILTTEHDGDDGLIVTFSDGTTGAYVVEELLELRPFRERLKTKKTELTKKGALQDESPDPDRHRYPLQPVRSIPARHL